MAKLMKLVEVSLNVLGLQFPGHFQGEKLDSKA